MTMSTREIIARVIFRFHFWFLITILTKHTCTCDMALGLATLSRPPMPAWHFSLHSSLFSFASRNYKTSQCAQINK